MESDRILRVEGLGDCYVDDYIMGSEDVLGPASATSFRNAMAKYAEIYGEQIEAFLTAEQPHRGNRELVQPISVPLGLSGLRLTVTAIDYLVDPYPATLSDYEPSYRKLLEPLLTRQRAEIERFWSTDSSDGSTVVGIEISVPTRGRTVAEIAAMGSEFDFLVHAANGSLEIDIDAPSALDLLKFGQGALLEGQPESSFLEVKEVPYLKTKAAKLELAKDVAAFANTGSDGLIAIGFQRRKSGDQDTIGPVRPFNAELMKKESIRGMLSNRVIPRVENLDIGVVEMGSGRIVGWIYVPAQKLSLSPFLVRGSNVGGKVKDNFFSLPRRDGEHTNFSDPETIHAWISAGQRCLRG